MVCPRCSSNLVQIYPYTKTKLKNRGCFGWLLWVLLAIVTCGLILIIPLVTNTKIKQRTYNKAICQNCGYSWRVR